MLFIVWLAFFAWLIISGLVAKALKLLLIDPFFGSGTLLPLGTWLRLLIMNLLIITVAAGLYFVFNFFVSWYVPGKTFWQLVQETYEKTLRLFDKKQP